MIQTSVVGHVIIFRLFCHYGPVTDGSNIQTYGSDDQYIVYFSVEEYGLSLSTAKVDCGSLSY